MQRFLQGAMVTAVPAMSPSFRLSRLDTARPAILIDSEVHPPFAYVSYLETDDVLYVGRGYVAIHAAKAGEKRLRLPQRRRLTQVLPAPVDLSEADEFQFAMERFETRRFRVWQTAGPAAPGFCQRPQPEAPSPSRTWTRLVPRKRTSRPASMASGVPLEPAMPSPLRAGSRFPPSARPQIRRKPRQSRCGPPAPAHDDDSLTGAFLKQPRNVELDSMWQGW